MPGLYATVGTASAAVRARRPWRTRRPPIGLNQATSHGRRTLTGDKPSAPLCEEFIAVDVATELAECDRQVAASATPP